MKKLLKETFGDPEWVALVIVLFVVGLTAMVAVDFLTR